MILVSILFWISLVIAFGMLAFRDWEIRTLGVNIDENAKSPIPQITFRQIEKNMLHLTKHIVQAFVLIVAKTWFIAIAKTKNFLEEKWPKIHERFQKKPVSPTEVKLTFVRRAILESKAKIRRIKETVKMEHEEQVVQESKREEV
jgi:hypothetical protein